MTQALQQSTTTLPPEELLCTLVGWVQAEDALHGREALKAYFYRYARDTFGLPAKTFDYSHDHKNFNGVAANRVDNALNRLCEGGVGIIQALENDNHWQPGQRVRVLGYANSHYEPRLKPGDVWNGFCECPDFDKNHRRGGIECISFCPHLIICFYLALAYKELKIGSTRYLHLEETSK